MGVLTLNSAGLLDPGIHGMTVDEVAELFVDGTGDHDARRRIFRRWVRHSESLRSLLPVERQWVDGSFVTDKAVPGDIDVVSFVNGPALDALLPATRALVEALVSGPLTKATWGVDSYLVPVYPPGHPAAVVTRRGLAAWEKQWSGVRGSTTKKGFVEVKYV